MNFTPQVEKYTPWQLCNWKFLEILSGTPHPLQCFWIFFFRKTHKPIGTSVYPLHRSGTPSGFSLKWPHQKSIPEIKKHAYKLTFQLKFSKILSRLPSLCFFGKITSETDSGGPKTYIFIPRLIAPKIWNFKSITPSSGTCFRSRVKIIQEMDSKASKNEARRKIWEKSLSDFRLRYPSNYET